MTRWIIRAQATVERTYAVEAETAEAAVKMLEENQAIQCLDEDETSEEFEWKTLRKENPP